MTTKKTTARKTTRIHYGIHPETGKRLYWTVKVRNATKKVIINGTIEDAMKGNPGQSINCHLANVAKSNSSAFPHPALYISFLKSTALVITKITNGQFTHCVRYRHNYGKYVDINDTDPTKAVIKAHPELFNRQFVLHPYKEGKPHWREEYGRKETGKRSQIQMARGELNRLRKAGLVNLPGID